MPTYEYVCRACGYEFEEFQSIKADPIAVCPKCRKKKVERKIGLGGAVIFKGGGFYETDYRSESYKSGEEAAKKANEPAKEAASAGSDKRGDAQTNTKTDARTDARTDAKSEANGGAKPRATTDGGTGASRGDSSGSAEAKSNTTSDASAAAAEKKRIEDRATHHSRIGRGIGNVVKKTSDTSRGKNPTAAKGNSSARAAKPTKKSSRK
jgi:putative FmdB family regulatory protein